MTIEKLNYEGFIQSISDEAAPSKKLAASLQGLWWDAAGDWDAAHQAVQPYEEDSNCCLVHAYLHRKEGDIGNADYWYRRAGKKRPQCSLDKEWQAIVEELLEK